MKQRMKRILSLLLAAVMLAGAGACCAAAQSDPVEARLQAMTTEEKITQMLMIAPRYYDGSGLTQLNEPFRQLFRRYAFGGAILFAQNIATAAQTVRFVDSLQTANAGAGRTQLLVSVDQEGGSVSRLATGTQLTGSMALGAIGRPAAAYTTGAIIGEELAALGIQVDFAPVMDVNSNPANPVIGTRSFSDDPALVSALGTGFIEGLHSAGVMTALKHFPGHGDTATDSHTGLPRIDKSREALQANELIPFAAGIAAGTELIMTAHIQFPQLERATYRSKLTGEDVCLPATLSKAIMTDLLRGELGYQGLIVTDAMTMDAITRHFDPLDAMTLAINAGVDLLLMPNNPYSAAGMQELEALIAGAVARAEDGTISMALVNAAVRRILTLKEKHGLLAAYDGRGLEDRIAAATATVGSQAHHEAEFELAKQSITLTKNENNLLPLRAPAQKVLILTAYANELLSVNYGLALARAQALIPPETQVTVACYGDTDAETIDAQIRAADVIVAISELTRVAGLNPNTAAGAKGARIDQMIATAHAAGAAFIVLSARLPYDCVRFPAADAVLLCWSDKGMSEDPRERAHDVPQYGPCIPAAVYMMFAKDEAITGTLPVNIPALTQEYTFSEEIALARGFGLRYQSFCPVCGETHDRNLLDRVRGALHALLHWIRTLFARLTAQGELRFRLNANP